LQFNISHSGTTAPIALVRGCQIGGNVERIPPDLEAEAIAERFLSAAEKELLSALPQQHKYAAFFHASTAKKPYSRPRQRAAPLSDFDVSVAPGEPAALLATRRSRWGRPLASAKHWEWRSSARRHWRSRKHQASRFSQPSHPLKFQSVVFIQREVAPLSP
jgi:phosphopantetheinyl transferase